MAMEFFTIQETAAMLKVSPMTIRRYIASGKLPVVRVGRRVRIRPEAIEQFVEPVESGASETAPEDIEDGIYEDDDGRVFLIYGGQEQEVRPLTFDDPLWDLVGMIKDDGPTDMAENHDKYLADIYADTHEQ